MKALNQPQKRAPTHAVELALASRGALTPHERELVRTLLADPQLHPAGSVVAQPANRIVLAGWVAWAAQLQDGRRQIITVHLAGDLLDDPPVSDLGMSYVALSAAQTADASALCAALEAGGSEISGLAGAWTCSRVAARERRVHHALRLGRLSAAERIANLLMELHDRQRRAGLADERSMPLPLTQEMLADILGLSVVHVNRVLQQLRRDELIVYRAGRVVVPDAERLARVAGRE